MQSHNTEADPSDLFTIFLYLFKRILINCKYIIEKSYRCSYSMFQLLPINTPVHNKPREYKSTKTTAAIGFQPDFTAGISANEWATIINIIKLISKKTI